MDEREAGREMIFLGMHLGNSWDLLFIWINILKIDKIQIQVT